MIGDAVRRSIHCATSPSLSDRILLSRTLYRRTGKPELIYDRFLIEAYLTTDLIKFRATDKALLVKISRNQLVHHGRLNGIYCSNRSMNLKKRENFRHLS